VLSADPVLVDEALASAVPPPVVWTSASAAASE
jgi:hypothetical protein